MSKNRIKYLTVVLVILVSLFGNMGCDGNDPLDPYRKDGTPLVQYISPKAGVVGTTITAVGEQFGATKGSGTVKVFCGPDGSAVEANILGWNDEQIMFRVSSAQVLDAKVVLEVKNDRGQVCPYPVYVTIESAEE